MLRSKNGNRFIDRVCYNVDPLRKAKMLHLGPCERGMVQTRDFQLVPYDFALNPGVPIPEPNLGVKVPGSFTDPSVETIAGEPIPLMPALHAKLLCHLKRRFQKNAYWIFEEPVLCGAIFGMGPELDFVNSTGDIAGAFVLPNQPAIGAIDRKASALMKSPQVVIDVLVGMERERA